MTFLRAVRRFLLLAAHILVGLVVTPFILQRPRTGYVRTSPRVTSWWHSRACDILGVEITVDGHRPQPPALIASNHVSWLDIIVLGCLTQTVFLSKHEIRHWPVVGWLAARAGTLFIRRGDGEAGVIKDQIAAHLLGNGLLTLFPEGTTTDGREVRPFFSRLFAAAIESDTPVVPVALRYHVDGQHDAIAPYTGDQPITDNLRGLITRPRTQIHVAFGEPLRSNGHSRREVARLAHDAVLAALRSPRPLTGVVLSQAV